MTPRATLHPVIGADKSDRLLTMLKLLRFPAIAVLVLGVGCSTSDDCQKATAKLRPLVEDRARLRGEVAPDEHMSESDKDKELEKLVEQCRTKRKQHPDDPMLTMNCLLAAKDDVAIRACVASANE